nr:hypothetical protein [uncultured Cellulosilyticum sp.]
MIKLRLSELLKVKSIVTIIATGTFAYLAITGKMDVKDAVVLITMVFTYLFNKDVKEDAKIEN